MANYELEYGEQKDPSAYVKFPVHGKKNEFLIIWTTTPWTLVANMAVMAHPDFTYVKVKVNGEKWILAKERLDAVVAIANPLGLKVAIEEEFSGKKLEKMKYVHPLLEEVPVHSGKEFENFCHVTMSDRYVTLEDGTGLVHTAPGHGPEDFEIGKREGIPPFCPVDMRGVYTKDAGKYKGKKVMEAGKEVLADLEAKGLLLHVGMIEHRYPHCWRCKTPLIFGAKDQWFIMVSRIREQMLSEIENCKWQPAHAKVWFRDFVSNAPDWCISRQRYWGIPLPVWVCESCSHTKVFGTRAEIEKLHGHKMTDLHRPYIDEFTVKCEKCSGTMRRVPDVLDVWFDSGNAIWASLNEIEMKRWFPCDFIVEGKDQIRGWFYSQLGAGIIAYGQIPYKSLLMHGHFVDEKGEKMSKSVGNFVPLEEITGKYGADTFRLWTLDSVVWDDLKFNWDAIKDAHRALGILWNVHLYLQRFMELEGFDPRKVGKNEEEVEDAWIYSRMNSLAGKCTEAMERYEIHSVARMLREFVVSDLSRLYMKLAKKRLTEGRERHSALKAIYDATLMVCRLSAPFTPFISEEIYQNIFRKFEKEESVSLLGWNSGNGERVNAHLEKQMDVAVEVSSALATARQSGNVKLRWPLEEAVIASASTEVRDAVERLPSVIESFSNVKKLKIAEKAPVALSFTVNSNKIGAAFKKDAKAVAEELAKAGPEELRKGLADGRHELVVGAVKFPIKPEMVLFKETPPEGFALAEFSGGKVLLKTKMNQSLYKEAIGREVARRIQMQRKEMGLVETDLVEAEISGEEEFLSLLKGQEGALGKEVKAGALLLAEKPKLKGTSKDWEIEEYEVKITVKKA